MKLCFLIPACAAVLSGCMAAPTPRNNVAVRQVPFTPDSGTIAIRCGLLIDGVQGLPLMDALVVIRDGRITYNEEGSDFHYVDLFGHGPAPLTTWTSSYSDTGVLGAADLATAEKGKAAVDEAAKQLARLAQEFAARPKHPRVDHHLVPPTMPMPWESNP